MELFFVILAGVLIGSFCNVLIRRTPEDYYYLMEARSMCRSCFTTLAWYENIPLLSFIFLRGKCRYCKDSISWQYPIVEILGTGITLLMYYTFGLNVQGIFTYIFLIGLMIIFFTDWNKRVIPDLIAYPIIILGLAWSLLNPDMSVLFSFLYLWVGLITAFLIAMIYWLITKRDGMGPGDGLLLGMIGVWLGIKLMFISFFLAAALGVVYLCLASLIKRKRFSRFNKMPMGSFICLAAVICLFYGQKILEYYSQYFH